MERYDLGATEWFSVDQKRVDIFADATEDQWIHVDPELADPGPFGTTITHGYLTLSLLPRMHEQLLEVTDEVRRTNYGLDKVRSRPAGDGWRIHLSRIRRIDETTPSSKAQCGQARSYAGIPVTTSGRTVLLSRMPETPHPNQNEVLLQIRAVGVNFPDLLITKGRYQNFPSFPALKWRARSSAHRAAQVSAPSGSRWKRRPRGCLHLALRIAEQVNVPLNCVVCVPDSVEFDSAAAAAVVNSHTMYFASSWRGAVKPGQTVLMLGAAGGIGTAAVPGPKGARVIAGVADGQQGATAEVAGATKIHRASPDLTQP